MDLVTETFHFPGDIKSVFIFSFLRAGDNRRDGNQNMHSFTEIDASLKKQSVI